MIRKCHPLSSKGSILQYFRPSLSYSLSLRSLFCLFLSGRFTQILLYFSTKIYVVGTQKNRLSVNLNMCFGCSKESQTRLGLRNMDAHVDKDSDQN